MVAISNFAPNTAAQLSSITLISLLRTCGSTRRGVAHFNDVIYNLGRCKSVAEQRTSKFNQTTNPSVLPSLVQSIFVMSFGDSKGSKSVSGIFDLTIPSCVSKVSYFGDSIISSSDKGTTVWNFLMATMTPIKFVTGADDC
ncbi:hypothetical protein BCR33DRAFT_713730 [Rhizoclosmatium globosum]|uniref:Uncharacterized protein n=1 Tax=Rhizoclosmatium globosum TaxID=329046 RepID=A0A1Y2CQZ0_9FUNG|nr:hypothetical protein BCR33DRAFT_713730 [Rhizoclosmatium globosum]|eukprot:ORY49383.1 hypothetical protein BCR33DRAFT_713730 [Rhizoclosmatium globosum]